MKLNHIIGCLLLINSAGVFANDSDIYRRLDSLFIRASSSENKITALESNLATLKAQVAQIPSPTRLEAGEGVSLEGNRINVRFPRHQVGEHYHGGLVFQVDESGQHGLIAALKDASDEGLAWRNGAAGNKTTNARADGIDAGETNTRLIVAAQTIDNQKGQFAALAAMTFKVASDGLTPCADDDTPCYGNWYLPSAHELKLMHQALYQSGLASFEAGSYWSSTESSVTTAFLLDFSTGKLVKSLKSTPSGRVRPISRF